MDAHGGAAVTAWYVCVMCACGLGYIEVPKRLVYARAGRLVRRGVLASEAYRAARILYVAPHDRLASRARRSIGAWDFPPVTPRSWACARCRG